MRLTASFVVFNLAHAMETASVRNERGLGTEVDQAALAAAIECNKKHIPLKFVLLKDEAVNAAVEDDIRRDLAKIGL